MNNERPKKIVLHGCYFVKDKDLKIATETFGHDVFVVKISKNKKKVKVKTITSIEKWKPENGQRVFKKNKKHTNYVESIHNGEIIVISKKDLRTERLSGVYNKGIWVNKNKLYKSKFSVKYPRRYNHIIGQ